MPIIRINIDGEDCWLFFNQQNHKSRLMDLEVWRKGEIGVKGGMIGFKKLSIKDTEELIYWFSKFLDTYERTHTK